MTTTHAPKPGLDTIALHGGQNVDPATKARAVPIYQTTSYVFDDTGHAARLFALEEFGNIYTRIMNPTTDVLEQRIAALEGGVGALAVASGQAAVVYSILNVAHAGDHIVSSASLYGGTYNAFFHTLPKYGITTTFVEPGDLAAWKAAVKPNTKAFFAETIGNPKVDVLDVKRGSGRRARAGVPLIVDNTLPTPMLLRPIEYGADVVVHSATKFIGGHGTSIGGLIVDAGNFDWSNGTLPRTDRTRSVVSRRAIRQVVRPAGLHPQDARATAARRRRRALAVQRVPVAAGDGNAGPAHGAALLERAGRSRISGKHDKVTAVRYPGLREDPAYDLARGSTCPTAPVRSSRSKFRTRARSSTSSKLFSLLANVGDSKSLVIHPASTTHQQLSPAEQALSGITENTVRLSVGIESIEDIIGDLEQALAAT